MRGIVKGEIRSHLFSWVIWGTTTLIAFFAIIKGEAGIGAWPIGVSSALTLYITLLAYNHVADTRITRGDWLFFIAALSSLPLWFFTSDPLWAVVILTAVDLLGFGPTLRKASDRPHEENIPFFGLFMLRNVLVLGALEHYSLTTALFPAAIATACLGVVVLLICRRARA